MKTTFIVCCIALAASAAMIGCGDDPEETDDTASTEVSLEGDVMPVFAAQCAGCHAREGSPFPDAVTNGVYFETKEDILGNIGSFIIAEDSAGSGLVGVMKRDFPVGATPTLMPPPDVAPDPVPQADVDVFAQWIDEGAQDN